MWGQLAIFRPKEKMSIKSILNKLISDCVLSEVTFGRSSDANVQFEPMNVSKIHFMITKIDSMILIKDCNSLNGTLVNSTKIPKEKFVTLGHLNEIQAGDVYCVFMDCIQYNNCYLPLLNNYFICQNNELGRGTFATVKLAFDCTTGQRLACKVISKKVIGKSALKDSKLEKQQLEQEINILFQISHPNIVKVHDVVQTDDFVYIFLDRILGGNFS
jgi:hypothetical protein